jgi:glutaredoxin
MKYWMLVLGLIVVAAQADTYRWEDANGKIHYSDTPPPPNARNVELKKITGGKPDELPLPYTLQQAVKNFPVTLFTSDCGDACTRARQVLVKRGIPYTEIDAKEHTGQEELHKLVGPTLQVPVLKIGQRVLKGIEEGQWNTALDIAGYPSTAMIPPREPNRPAKAAPAAEPAPEQEAPTESSESQ